MSSACLIWILSMIYMSAAQDTWVSHANKAYYIYDRDDDGVSFLEAEQLCVAKKARLPVFTSYNQTEFLKSTLTGAFTIGYWLNMEAPQRVCTCAGVSVEECSTCRMSWSWKDGTRMNYTHWKDPSNSMDKTPRPLGEGRRCAVMRPVSGHWEDTSCGNDGNNFRHICQYDCSSIGCHIERCLSQRENSYSCYCLPGFMGPICDLDIDECDSDPCLYGGRCNNQQNNFSCECPQGTSGHRCQINFDECQSSPCFNNGTCSDKINGYVCECNQEYTGLHCETKQNKKTDNTVLIIVQVVTAITAALSLLGCAYMGFAYHRKMAALKSSQQLVLSPIEPSRTPIEEDIQEIDD